MVELIDQSQMACDQLIDVSGRAVIQAVLQLSAAQVAGGPQQQGKRRSSNAVFHDRPAGQVMLSDRKLQVERPRLRAKGQNRGREVEIPAYTAMPDQSPLGARMLETLLRGVFTRNYKSVIPQMAETVSSAIVPRGPCWLSVIGCRCIQGLNGYGLDISTVLIWRILPGTGDLKSPADPRCLGYLLARIW
jgi:hypothetical protein